MAGNAKCSFCGKRQDDVGRLIGGPDRVFICDECVRLCGEILRDPPSAPTATVRTSQRRSSRGFRWPWQATHMDSATGL